MICSEDCARHGLKTNELSIAMGSREDLMGDKFLNKCMAKYNFSTYLWQYTYLIERY